MQKALLRVLLALAILGMLLTLLLPAFAAR
jgi:type II secretory pathway pseudopilin PulG